MLSKMVLKHFFFGLRNNTENSTLIINATVDFVDFDISRRCDYL